MKVDSFLEITKKKENGRMATLNGSRHGMLRLLFFPISASGMKTNEIKMGKKKFTYSWKED